jgi:serine/threonine-protein kinase
LEASHEQGIIHRDLKPANVKVRADGTVKVLDFGLAKAMEPASAMSVNAMTSPTLSMHATQAGIILGTAAYMSPEQAAGKPVDKRSDLWAFGVVLMEMLTGRPVFMGETVSHVLAAVLRAEPDWTALPAHTPTPIRRLLRRCLEKDRKRRLADAADARLEIDEALAPSGDASTVSVTMHEATWRRVLPWASTGALAAGLAVVLMLWVPWQKASPPAALRLEATLGADASLVIVPGGAGAPAGNAIAVSPDGSRLAFVAQSRGGDAPRLYVRHLDQLPATLLAGTEGAMAPFFSPDGQWLGFFGGGKLKKIAVAGGAPVTLADTPVARGGSWAEDGTIVFAPGTAFGGNLWRVPAKGGTPEQLTALARGEATHRWPQVLPGGRAVLYTVSATTGVFANAWLVVQPLPAGTPQIVQRGGSYGRYLPSGLGSPKRAEREGGHLTWVHDGTLFAAPFDLATLAVTGPAVPVVTGVLTSTNSGNAQMAVSHTGTLVYLPGGESASAATIDWLTRDGKTMPLRFTPANWSGVQIAPDGRRLAFSLTDTAKSDVWTYDLARDASTRSTFGPGTERQPVWTPDGQRLVYASAGKDGIVQNLYWQRADGSGEATRLTTSPNGQYPGSWHPSGHFLAFYEIRPQTAADLLILPVGGDEASGWKPGPPTVFLSGPSVEQQPRFSPDGHWLAYESNESGTNEINVRPFPGPGGRFPISTGGGTNAVWSRTRPELLYLAPDRRIMAVPYRAAGDAFVAEKPRVWSETQIQVRPSTGATFDLHPDGERVAMAPGTAATAGPTHVTLIFNFFDELRRLAPSRK